MLWEIIKIALDTLRAHKFRSFLTVLSVMIGAFSIVVMLSLAESGSMTLSRSVEEVGGMRLVWWVPNPPRDARDRSLYSKGITREDINAIRGVPFVDLATGMATWDQQTAYVSADNTLKVDVVGVLPGMLDGLEWTLKEGRPFQPEEEAAFARVAILTDGVAQTLFPGKSAVGQRITVVGKPYLVTGVLEKRKVMGIGLGFDWDKSLFIPMATAEKREGLSLKGMVLVAFTHGPQHNADVMALGNAAMLARHNGVEDFQSINFGEMLKSFYQFFQAVNLIVALIASISLLAGGIGVMNIMLVSVTERVREIGIRKALGATIPNVLFQFIGEATVLSTLGGLFGVAAGLGVTAIAHLLVSNWSDFWVSHYSVGGVALALGVTTAIGLFFGAVPAWQAARLDIVECLRR